MAISPVTQQSSSQIESDSPYAFSELRALGVALLDWKLWLKIVIIVGATVWIYRPVLHGGWMMDDDFYLYHNPLLGDPHRLWKAWFEPGSFIEYYPIQQSVQWAQWQLWGENTFGYHLTNVLLHAFSALLIWRVLKKFQLRWAWLGGLLFAVHPALVESVVWISELKNTLSLPPFLIAICFFIEYENHGHRRDYYAALGCFVIAMLCKVSMVSFPVVILLYAWWRRGRVDREDVENSVPFFIVSLVLVGLTLWCGRVFAESHRMEIIFPTGGLLFRVALIGQTFSFYVATVLWPFGLLPIYQHWTMENPSMLQLLPWPIFGALFYWFWLNRESWGRSALLGFGFFTLNLVPFLGFIIISYMRFTWVMDHFLYIAIIGLLGIIVAGLEWSMQGMVPQRSIFTRVGIALGVIILAISSHQYSKHFVTQKNLWTYTIAHNPEAFAAYNNLGSILLKENHNEEALPMFEEALKLDPTYFEATYNKGLSLDRLKRPREAIEQYENAVRLAPKNMEARLTLARTLEDNGDTFGAIQQYLMAERYAPEMSEVHAALGALLIEAGRYPEAADEFSQTIRLYPSAASPHNDLGNALYMMSQTAAAMDEYREAVRLNPTLVEAHNNLAGALQHSGHLDEAIKEFETALRLDPSNPKLNVNLANALAADGRKQDAIKLYQTALRFDPRNAEARAGLQALGAAPVAAPKR